MTKRRQQFLALVLLTLTFIAGCATMGLSTRPFEVISTEDRFADPDAPDGYIGLNNKLTNKSSHGGVHIDAKGIYLNPFVAVDPETSEILTTGFFFAHFAFEPDDGFNPLREAIFLTAEGRRIALQFGEQDFDFDINSWNTVTREYNTSYSESATAVLSADDFLKLSNATALEVRLIGEDRTLTLDQGDVRESFLGNLRLFANSHVKGNANSN